MEEMRTEHAAALRKKDTQVYTLLSFALYNNCVSFAPCHCHYTVLFQVMQLNTLIAQFKKVRNLNCFVALHNDIVVQKFPKEWERVIGGEGTSNVRIIILYACLKHCGVCECVCVCVA